MGSSAANQLQASAAQAVADMGGSRSQHDESQYPRGLPNKRPRVDGDPEIKTDAEPGHAEARPV